MLLTSARDTLDDAQDAARELEAVKAVVLFFWCNSGATWYFRCPTCRHVHSGGPRLEDFPCAICDELVDGLLTANRKC